MGGRSPQLSTWLLHKCVKGRGHFDERPHLVFIHFVMNPEIDFSQIFASDTQANLVSTWVVTNWNYTIDRHYIIE